MKTKAFNRDEYAEQTKGDCEYQRNRLAGLIDEAYDVYRKSGREPGEYAETQFFQGLLLRAVNGVRADTQQRVGANLVAILFMKALILHYKDNPANHDEANADGIR